MKTSLLIGGLMLLLTGPARAQSRFSLAPAYWFNYSPYSYHFTTTFNGSTTNTIASGYSIVSSFGLTAQYQFTPQWDVSVGVSYYRDTNHLKNPPSPYGDPTPFTSKGWQLPLLVNYRLTTHRLSPYFSGGVLFSKSETFTSRPITTDGVVGLGLSYQFNPGLFLLLQPTTRYSFYRPISDAVYTYTHYNSYSLGVQTQLIWSF